jgi:hypothetical protein
MVGEAGTLIDVLDCTEKVHAIKITAVRAVNQLVQL